MAGIPYVGPHVAASAVAMDKTLTKLVIDKEGIPPAAWELVRRSWDMTRPVRLLGVTALALSNEPFAVQQSLFDDAPREDPRREALEKSLDAIRGKYGRNAIAGAYVLKNGIGLEELSIDEAGAGQHNDTDDGRQLTKGPLGGGRS